jgi:transposase-like protein
MTDYVDVLREAGIDAEGKEEWIRELRQSHGDIEDAKGALFLISEEEDFEVTAEDVESVTDSRPIDTFE